MFTFENERTKFRKIKNKIYTVVYIHSMKIFSEINIFKRKTEVATLLGAVKFVANF